MPDYDFRGRKSLWNVGEPVPRSSNVRAPHTRVGAPEGVAEPMMQGEEAIIRRVIDPEGRHPNAKVIMDWMEPVPILVKGAYPYSVSLPWFFHESQIDRERLLGILENLGIETFSIYRQVAGYEVCGIMRAVANRYVVEVPDILRAVMLRLAI